jgi:flagellar biosynthetic protein FliQ
MTNDLALDLLRESLITAMVIAAPILAALFVTSFVVSLLQTLTGLQDLTVSAVPRLAVGAAVIVGLLPWIVDRLGEFSTQIYRAGG